MSEYEPGTVATATVRGVPGVRVFRSRNSTRVDQWFSSDPVQGDFWHEDRVVTDIRPLVVLDLSGGRDLRYTIADLRDAAKRTRNSRLADIADQIEAQTRPPKPPEPTGLGAVVEDAEGERWVRVNQLTGTQEWRCCDFIGEFRRWPAIDAVRVLSPGVQP